MIASAYGPAITTLTIGGGDEDKKISLCKSKLKYHISFGSEYNNSQAFAIAIAHMAVPRLARTRAYRWIMVVLGLIVFGLGVIFLVPKVLCNRGTKQTIDCLNKAIDIGTTHKNSSGEKFETRSHKKHERYSLDSYKRLKGAVAACLSN